MPDPSPIETLSRAMDRAGSCACVGIDPVLERIPERIRSGPGYDVEHVRTFCMVVLDAIKDRVGVVKPQSACFERFGSMGCGVLEDVIDRARELGFVVILDAKRGDIGSSATHYAVGASNMGAHWITCSPYMGRSSIEPFLNEGLGVFALCKTSNPDASEIQAQTLSSGGDVSTHIASIIRGMGTSVGAVVGATNDHDEVRSLRRTMPDTMFLVPGVGAQGGTIEDVRAMTREGATKPSELGVVINASRSVLYPDRQAGESWEDAIERSAGEFACACAALHAG